MSVYNIVVWVFVPQQKVTQRIKRLISSQSGISLFYLEDSSGI